MSTMRSPFAPSLISSPAAGESLARVSEIGRRWPSAAKATVDTFGDNSLVTPPSAFLESDDNGRHTSIHTTAAVMQLTGTPQPNKRIEPILLPSLVEDLEEHLGPRDEDLALREDRRGSSSR